MTEGSLKNHHCTLERAFPAERRRTPQDAAERRRTPKNAEECGESAQPSHYTSDSSLRAAIMEMPARRPCCDIRRRKNVGTISKHPLPCRRNEENMLCMNQSVEEVLGARRPRKLAAPRVHGISRYLVFRSSTFSRCYVSVCRGLYERFDPSFLESSSFSYRTSLLRKATRPTLFQQSC